MDLVYDYEWGAGALAHLYRELNNEAHYKTSRLAGYLTLS